MSDELHSAALRDALRNIKNKAKGARVAKLLPEEKRAAFTLTIAADGGGETKSERDEDETEEQGE